jgi:hypothetical protein
MAAHARSQDNSQWLKNSTGLGDGKLAIPAAIKHVSPAWITAKMKWLYLRGIAKHEIGAFRSNDRVGFRMLVPTQAGCN